MLHFLSAVDPVDEVLPHAMLSLPYGLYLTNQMVMALVAAGLMVLIIPLLFAKASSDAPSGSRNFFEAILEYLRLEVFRPALKEHTERFLPFLWTLFFFILFCNLLGQIPVDAIVTICTGHEAHFWGTPTGNIAITGGLAICAFFCIHVNGVSQVANDLRRGTYGHHPHHEEHSSNGEPGHEAAIDLDHMRGEALPADLPNDFRAIGNPTAHYADDEHPAEHKSSHPGHHPPAHPKSAAAAWLLALPLYLWNFAPHPFRPGPGDNQLMWIGDVFMWSILLALELLGAVIKPFALMIRLFANMISGHLVLGSLLLLIPITAGLGAQFAAGLPITLLSLLIRVLEVFVAFLQSYIFVFLTTLFLASAIAPEH
jgi:F0F1-type ATP synthase membrane subunit a